MVQEVDEFSRNLLEEAKRFLEKAGEENESQGQLAYLHASLVLGFSALEAHVNSIADDFLVREDQPLLHRSILSERDFKLEKGRFELTNQLKMYRLEDRIQFLYRTYSGEPLDRNSAWWAELKAGIDLRNKLVHPKDPPQVSVAAVEKALQSVVDALNALYEGVYRVSYPAAKLQLSSRLSF